MKYIRVNTENRISMISVNRPDQLNALSSAVLDELILVFTNAINDPAVYGMILTGSGEKAFIAGADIKEMADMSGRDAGEYSKKGQKLTTLIENAPKPVIAAVNGYALGGGCELAMSCHFRYASENARFGQPETSLGLLAGFGGTQRLPRLIGKGHAMELLLTGQWITAEKALSVGLINKIFPIPDLIPEVIKTLSLIVAKAPIALARTIKSINHGIDLPIDEALLEERRLFESLFSTRDAQEGLIAFIEKRKPVFTGK